MKNRKASLFLLVSQIVYALMSAVWLLVALMSIMMLNSEEALSNAPAILYFLLVWLYPLALIASAAVSWLLYHKRKFKIAVWVNLIPLLWVLPLFWLVVSISL